MKCKFILLAFIFTLLLTACTNDPTKTTEKEPENHLVEIYQLALDAMMDQDPALNSGIEFIAIDMSKFADLTKEDKDEILSFFQKKYNVKVMDATFEELQAKGLFNKETLVLDGILLRVEKVELNKNVFFKSSKFRSGTGAIGVETTVHFKDGKWQVKESKMTWIS